MSSITINSNIASLNAQRRFGQSTEALQENFSRLSSGLRINSAKDDASGLAIAETLKVDARVYSQGRRNLNDAISLLNIAEGAIQQLSSLTIRQRELASQSANGTLSSVQREALNEEANALVDEFNRIVNSTDFNNSNLIDGEFGELRIQAGYGENGGIEFGLGDDLGRNVGDGTFTLGATFSNPAIRSTDVVVADVNGDGINDILNSEYSDAFSVRLGQGDGSFSSATLYNMGMAGGTVSSIVVGDIDGDGYEDVAISGVDGSYDTTVAVRFGVGDGTFGAVSTVDLGYSDRTNELRISDFNNDGNNDLIIVADDTGGNGFVRVALNDGDRTFSTGAYTTSPSLLGTGLAVGDINGDGFDDIAISANTSTIRIRLGQGDGTFGATTNITNVTSTRKIEFADVNQDGSLDILTTGGRVTVHLNNGDGTFRAPTSYTGGSQNIEVGDINGDSYDDIVTINTSSAAFVQLGNGDGSFTSSVSYSAATTSANGVGIGDTNNDGAFEVIVSGRDGSGALLSTLDPNIQKINTIAYLDLSTRGGALAAMNVLDDTLDRISAELGSIGSAQSRFDVARSNLTVAHENFISAASQIQDADVATEAASLVRNQILQQAGAAILAQANTQPQLALTLLSATQQ